MHNFRGDGGHTRQSQWPPVRLMRLNRHGAAIVIGLKWLGLHTEAGDGLLDLTRAVQGMAHTKDAVDQIELQLFDAWELGEFVLDQGLIGWAIHGVDAKTAEPSMAAGLGAQLHLGWRCFGAAAAMAMVIVRVVMTDRLVHGASLNWACCQLNTL